MPLVFYIGIVFEKNKIFPFRLFWTVIIIMYRQVAMALLYYGVYLSIHLDFRL